MEHTIPQKQGKKNSAPAALDAAPAGGTVQKEVPREWCVHGEPFPTPEACASYR